jgi:hypothetical protein
MRILKNSLLSLVLIPVVLILASCEGVNVGKPIEINPHPSEADQRETVFGSGGLSLGGKSENERPNQGTGIGVNAYLWRATLDTVSFMPLASADPFGGVVLTDWHSTVAAPNERYKLNVYILGQALRADGIRVAAFRQIKNQSGEWNALNIDPKAVIDIENSILTRARQLRAESAPE